MNNSYIATMNNSYIATANVSQTNRLTARHVHSTHKQYILFRSLSEQARLTCDYDAEFLRAIPNLARTIRDRA